MAEHAIRNGLTNIAKIAAFGVPTPERVFQRDGEFNPRWYNGEAGLHAFKDMGLGVACLILSSYCPPLFFVGLAKVLEAGWDTAQAWRVGADAKRIPIPVRRLQAQKEEADALALQAALEAAASAPDFYVPIGVRRVLPSDYVS